MTVNCLIIISSCVCEQVTVSGYVEFVKAFQPNVFECLCDSVSSETSKLKRIRKSVDRTLRFLDEIITLKQDCQVEPSCLIMLSEEGLIDTSCL